MKKSNLPSILSTFIVCYAFWIIITWSFKAQELIAGAIVCLAVAVFSARFFIHSKAFYLFNPKRFFTLICYCLVIFMKELWKANMDVAKRAFSPKMNINPGIVKIPVEVESEYGLAMLANSITLTPGTITMDIVEENGKNYFYIHWIDVAAQDEKAAGEAIKGTLEKWIRRVFR